MLLRGSKAGREYIAVRPIPFPELILGTVEIEKNNPAVVEHTDIDRHYGQVQQSARVDCTERVTHDDANVGRRSHIQQCACLFELANEIRFIGLPA
jgi:hypothetical protein